MMLSFFTARLAETLRTLITNGYTYTGVYDVGRGGAAAIAHLPRTGPGFSGWYGRALMGDAFQAVPVIALTREDNVLAFIGDAAAALVPDPLPTLTRCAADLPARHQQAPVGQAHAALSPGGRVLIFNTIQNDAQDGPPMAMLFSAYFLALASGTGRYYTWEHHSQWLRETGFVNIEQLGAMPYNHGLCIGSKP